MAMPAETKRPWESPQLRSAAAAAGDALHEPLTTRHRAWTRQLAAPTLLLLLGFAAMSVDVPLAQWIRTKGLPSGLNKLSQLAEVFGHGLGAAAILITAWVLVPKQRTWLPRVVAATYLPGLAADGIKLFLARQRPHAVVDLANTRVFDTFRGWFPFFSHGSQWQSFPSSHTGVAVGLAMGLSWLFPRGRWLFFTFAVLAASQRVASSNHFLSDVLWGAAIGWICAAACLPGGWLSPAFDRLENGLFARWAR